MTKSIAELSEEIHQNAKEKGFWENGLELPTKLMLIVSEVSEAMEADRKGKYYKGDWNFDKNCTEDPLSEDEPESYKQYWINNFQIAVKDTVQDEIADAVIRLFDLAKYMNIDLQWHIEQKMKYNKMRPYKHGKRY